MYLQYFYVTNYLVILGITVVVLNATALFFFKSSKIMWAPFVSPSTCVTAGLCCILPNAPISHVTKAGYSHAHKKKVSDLGFYLYTCLKNMSLCPILLRKKILDHLYCFYPPWNGVGICV